MTGIKRMLLSAWIISSTFAASRLAAFKRHGATLLKNAGIRRRIRPYDLRHAFATEAIAAGVDVGTVAQLMGHDPKMLLDHYQHVADKQKRAAVEALPEISITAKKLRQFDMAKNCLA